MMRQRSTSGKVLFKLLLVMAPCALLLAIIFAVLHELRHSFECQSNLRTLYHALELYEMERGALPKLAFFPDIPQEDTDSLRVVLESFGAGGSACVCPSAPENLRELGLTYVWNVRLNARKIPKGQAREWMLVDIQALSGDVPAPHLKRYHVLYSDGSVERIRNPLQELPGL